MTIKTREAVLARLRARLRETDAGCWQFTGKLMATGYGRMSAWGRDTLVHRLAYELLVGPIPEGLQLDHLCRNRGCANPAHLEPVTVRVNLLRGFGISAINIRKTHCAKGHPYDAENTCYGPGGRKCRTCGREYQRRRRARDAA